ncbi:P2Y purinoceptor 14-like [Pholidichthys leucotaenia]
MSGVLGAASRYNTSSLMNQTVNGTDCNPDEVSIHLSFIVIYSLVFLVGLILNDFIMNFYFCRPHRQVSSSMVIYLKNLAAADFLLCLSLPIRIINYTTSSASIRLLHCSFGAAALFLNMYVSILFMGYIAASRYLKIVHPSGTHVLQTRKATYIISTLTWVCVLTPTVTNSILVIGSQKKYTSTPSRCGTMRKGSVSQTYILMRTLSTIIFLSVLISLIFFYCRTSYKVLQAQKKQHSSSSSKKLAKSRRKMLVLVSVFCVCFVPHHLLTIPYIFLWKICSLYQVLFYMKEITTLLSVLNVCLDPLIYFVFCKALRAHLK